MAQVQCLKVCGVTSYQLTSTYINLHLINLQLSALPVAGLPYKFRPPALPKINGSGAGRLGDLLPSGKLT